MPGFSDVDCTRFNSLTKHVCENEVPYTTYADTENKLSFTSTIHTDPSPNKDTHLCTCINGNCALATACQTGLMIFGLQNIRSLLPKIDQIRLFFKATSLRLL